MRRTARNQTGSVSALFLLVLLMPPASFAQSAGDSVEIIGIREQVQPDYDALGVRTGAFLTRPALSVQEKWDDNIYRRPLAEESDFITVVQPEIVTRSDWNLHEVQFAASGTFGRHTDNSDEDYSDYSAGFGGRYDITYETYLTGAVQYDHLHEDRSSPDDVNGDEPTAYDRTTAKIGFRRGLARVKLDINGTFRSFSFDDSERGGTVIDNSGRDRKQYRGDVRLAYEYKPGYEIFVRAARDVRRYDETDITDRSSEGYETRAGASIAISGKTKGEIYGGYMEQDFEGAFEDIGAASYGGSLLWNVTGLTTLYADVNREILDTNSAVSSGYIRTLGTVGIDHALRRNIILGAEAGYNEDDFIGASAGTGERQDETWRAGLSAEYRPFRGGTMEVGYDYTERDSNLPSAVFTNNRLMAGIKLEF